MRGHSYLTSPEIVNTMPQKAYTSREMLDALIRFDTTSRLTNLPMIDFIREYLDGYGVESTYVTNEDGSKSNLYATIGPDDRGGVVLSGHTDVVPVDGQDWTSDPFEMIERDGLLYGRGTSDMKGFIASALALVPEFTAQPLKTPVHFAFTYDEEVGCFGVQRLVEQIVAAFPLPRVVIVGEPTSMTVVNAHKSGFAFMTEVTGFEGHSSATQHGVNAIMIAAELIGELNRIEAEMRERGDPSGRFEPPYTTVHVGTIEGGTALNIIPKTCRFKWEFRGLPGIDESEIPDRLDRFAREQLLPKMKAVAPEADIVTRQESMNPAFAPPEGSPAETLVLALARQNETHTVSYGTEAGFFQAADMPTVVCGPGDIAQAHKPDEFIAIAQLNECDAFMRRLIDHLRSG